MQQPGIKRVPQFLENRGTAVSFVCVFCIMLKCSGRNAQKEVIYGKEGFMGNTGRIIRSMLKYLFK